MSYKNLTCLNSTARAYLACALAILLAVLSNHVSAQRHRKAKASPMEVYTTMRNHAFTATPQSLGLNLPTDTSVYGVIMDRPVSDVIITLVAYSSGYRSIHTSAGHGYIDQETHLVDRSVEMLVHKAQEYRAMTARTAGIPAPDSAAIRLSLLTTGGIYTVLVPCSETTNKASPWWFLLSTATYIIKEFSREASEKY